MITLAELAASGPPYVDLLTGRTPSFACQADRRFSYCLHVPHDIDTSVRIRSWCPSTAPSEPRSHIGTVSQAWPTSTSASSSPRCFRRASAIRTTSTTTRPSTTGASASISFCWWPVRAPIPVSAPGSTGGSQRRRTRQHHHARPDHSVARGNRRPRQAVRHRSGPHDHPHPLTGGSRITGMAQLRDNLIDHGIEPAFETVGHEHAAIFPAANRFFDELLLRRR